MKDKCEELKRILCDCKKVAVAYSAGVDSTFLLMFARSVLGKENVLAVTVSSSFIPKAELKEAANFCIENDINHKVLDIDVLSIDGVSENPPDRCYLCKKGIFTKIKETAGDAYTVVEGSNADDVRDYRPGMRAIDELSVKSPLMEAGFTKGEIRQASKKMGLKTFDKPSFACLASRCAYGETITAKKLDMIDRAEQYLSKKGYKNYRVRVHGSEDSLLARIELDEADKKRLDFEETHNYLKEIGFLYVTLDLKGYRMGSMNEGINKKVNEAFSKNEAINTIRKKLEAPRKKRDQKIVERFSRTETLLGKEAMDKLRDSKIAVFGVGGVGGYVVEALARSGIGHFVLVDSDKVDITNINRQIIALNSTIGMSKVQVMKDRILDINPEADVEVRECFYLPETASEFDFTEYDYVVDAVDTVTAKIDIITRAKKCGVRVISSMGAGNKLDSTAFKVADISKTKICPLAKVIRYELKKRGIKDVKVVYSEEIPVIKKQIPASIAFVPSVCGLVMASEVVKDLTRYIMIETVPITGEKKGSKNGVN